MTEQKHLRAPSNGISTGASRQTLSAISVGTIVLAVIWVVFCGFVFWNTPPQNTNAVLIFIGAAILPAALLAVCAVMVEKSRLLQQDTQRLHTAVEALRHSFIEQNQSDGQASFEASISRKLTEIGEEQRKMALIEYINKVQKNSNLYFSTGIDKIVLQASKIFLQTLKAGIKAGKEFVSALNEALEKLGNTLSKKYDETTVEAIKTRVETEILENVDSESAPNFYNIAEIINNVAAGERGRAYEQKLLDVLNSFKIKELTVAKKTANVMGSNDPDIPIKFKNQESNIEVKLSSEEQMGSLTANYDMDTKSFKITKEVDPKINDIINQLLKEKQEDTDNYFKRAVELGGVKSKTGVKLNKKQREKLQDEGLQKKLSGKISTNSTQLLADLENKEGTYYIQMGEKGLFYLGKDILKLGVPKLEGNISLEYRIASGGNADKQ